MMPPASRVLHAFAPRTVTSQPLALSAAVAAVILFIGIGHASAQPLPTGWASQDIGAVGLAGSADYDAGRFTVRGAGANIWGSADTFHFANQLLAGDGEIVARVASMENTHSSAKAGVMIRETLTAGSRHVTLAMKPDGSVQFIARAAAGGTTEYVAGRSGRRWLRLVRSNGVFTAYVSTDGAAWTSLGSRAIAMGVNVWVGLAVCSHTTTALNTAAFDNVRVPAAPGGTDQPPTVSITSPSNGATFAAGTSIAIAATASDTDSTPVASVEFYASEGATRTRLGIDTTSPYTFSWSNVPAGSYSLTAVATDTAGQETTSAAVAVSVVEAGGGALPQGWASQDIGAVGLAGSADYDAGRFTVRGAGANIWGSADAFHFANQLLVGDGEIVARVASMENTHSSAKAGVMIRETLTAGSRQVTLAMRPDGSLQFISRAATGGSIEYSTGGRSRWLRLVRAGGTVTAYRSTDGVAWTSIGSRTVAMGVNVWVGLAVCSHTTSALNTALFDSVRVQAASAGVKTVMITGPPDGSTFPPGTGIVVSAAAAVGMSPTPLSHVEFWANDGTTTRNIGVGFATGSDGTDVYSYTPWWTNVPAGSYTITAVATYGRDELVTSQPVRVRVSTTPGADVPPTVVFTYPTAATRVPVGSTITVTAEASDPDGTPVAKVDFWESTYEGARFLGSTTAPPYAVVWSDYGYTGPIWLLAVVTDTAGLATCRWLSVTR